MLIRLSAEKISDCNEPQSHSLKALRLCGMGFIIG